MSSFPLFVYLYMYLYACTCVRREMTEVTTAWTAIIPKMKRTTQPEAWPALLRARNPSTPKLSPCRCPSVSPLWSGRFWLFSGWHSLLMLLRYETTREDDKWLAYLFRARHYVRIERQRTVSPCGGERRRKLREERAGKCGRWGREINVPEYVFLIINGASGEKWCR